MPRLPRFPVAAVALFLLISAIAWGGGVSDTTHAAATPRTIPWDCSDWQAAAAVADAEDARVSVILESLATNRGKTLYCAVDQSDTFSKAETWQAGKDRNERDDTVYYGENGRFRGFLAAQEGYLTDGESGVTGISRARIFEFPEEKRKRRWVTRTKRLAVPQSSERRARTIPTADITATGTQAQVQQLLRRNYWNQHLGSTHAIRDAAQRDAYWQELAETEALAYCEAEGYTRAVRVETTPRPADFVDSSTDNQLDDGWDYENLRENTANQWEGRAYQYVLWSATCEKDVRRRR